MTVDIWEIFAGGIRVIPNPNASINVNNKMLDCNKIEGFREEPKGVDTAIFRLAMP